jgi:hypothetical protein
MLSSQSRERDRYCGIGSTFSFEACLPRTALRQVGHCLEQGLWICCLS